MGKYKSVQKRVICALSDPPVPATRHLLQTTGSVQSNHIYLTTRYLDPYGGHRECKQEGKRAATLHASDAEMQVPAA